MDRGTRNYAIFLALLVSGLLFVALYEDPKVSSLNDLLEQDPQVASFPYSFRVLRVANGVATMSTPRSSRVPVARVLGILFPSVAGKSEASAAYQKAQKRLATVQTRARDMVLQDPEIHRVSWELDRDWLARHGVQIAPGY